MQFNAKLKTGTIVRVKLPAWKRIITLLETGKLPKKQGVIFCYSPLFRGYTLIDGTFVEQHLVEELTQN